MFALTLYDSHLLQPDCLADLIVSFGVLHVPINIPALAFTTGEDNVNVDRELKAHGYSNALSGFCGSIQVRIDALSASITFKLISYL